MHRLQTLWAGVAVALAGASSVGLARAQTTLHVTGSTTLAYTDNLLAAPSHPPSGEPGPLRIWYWTVSPGLELYHDSELSRYLLSYAHGFTFYLGHARATANSDTALARGIFSLSPFDEMTLAVGATRTQTALTALQADAAHLGQLPSNGQSTLLLLDATENLTHEFSPSWLGHQSLSFTVAEPTAPAPGPMRYSVTEVVGADYARSRDAIGFEMEATGYHSFALHRGGEDIAQQRYLATGPTLRWRHDLSDQWASELHGGATGVYWMDGNRPLAAYPVWGGSLQWHRQETTVAASYARTVAPNLLTNQVYVSDVLGLDGRILLWPSAHVAFVTSHRYSTNQLVGGQGTNGHVRVQGWLLETGIGWFSAAGPTITLTYRRFQQFGAPVNAPGLPDYTRNLVLLSLEGRFPSRAIEPIPTDQPQRVDRGDRDATMPGLRTPDNADTLPSETQPGAAAESGHPSP
jgi:hypothetical protein